MASGNVVGNIVLGMPSATTPAEPAVITGTSSPAELIPVLRFDDSTVEYWDFHGVLQGYGGGGLTVRFAFAHASQITGNVTWGAAIRRIADDAEDLDTTAHVYDFNDVVDAVPDVVGELSYFQIAFTDGADMDNLVNGERFILRIRRSTGGAVGDAMLLRSSIVILET